MNRSQYASVQALIGESKTTTASELQRMKEIAMSEEEKHELRNINHSPCSGKGESSPRPPN